MMALVANKPQSRLTAAPTNLAVVGAGDACE